MANVLLHRPFLYEDTEIGDWFITKDSRRTQSGKSRPVCKEYDACPQSIGTYRCTLPTSTYIGPVHDIYLHDGLVTIKVPSFADGRQCGYVNVSRYQISYAERIPRIKVMLWKRSGWRNHFVEVPEFCPGCRDSDDDDNDLYLHAPHQPRCKRHRPTWVDLTACMGIQQSHIDACVLCQADVRQAIQVKCVLKWLNHRTQYEIALKIAAYAGHRLR